MKLYFIPLLFVLSLFIIPSIGFAATPSVATSETTASAVEVKASRTVTVGALPANAETITIGSCVVTFTTVASSTTHDTNCTGGASIDRTSGTGDVSLTATLVATQLLALTNVSDAAHSTLAVSASSTSATSAVFTTSGTETSATAITFTDGTSGDITSVASVTGVVPAAQVVVFTPTNIGDDWAYTITINGTNYSYLHGDDETLKQVVEALQALVDADSAVSCTEDDAAITCTAVAAGTSFTYATSVTEPRGGTSRGGGGGGGGGRSSTSNRTNAPVFLTAEQTVPTIPQLPASASGAARQGGASTIARTLSSAMRGDDVSLVQRLLAQDTSLYPEGLVTGYYGKLTRAAVERFQVKHGIAVEGNPGYGWVGPRTRAKLIEIFGE